VCVSIIIISHQSWLLEVQRTTLKWRVRSLSRDLLVIVAAVLCAVDGPAESLTGSEDGCWAIVSVTTAIT